MRTFLDRGLSLEVQLVALMELHERFPHFLLRDGSRFTENGIVGLKQTAKQCLLMLQPLEKNCRRLVKAAASNHVGSCCWNGSALMVDW